MIDDESSSYSLKFFTFLLDLTFGIISRDMVENCESALDFRHLCTCRRRFRSLRRSLKVKHPRPSLARTRSKPTLEEMLTCFEFFLPLINDNLELLEHLASDFVKRQYEQNVIYTEVRYSPHFFASDAKAAHAAVTRGLRKACELYPVKVNQILCAINFRPDWSDEVVEMANSFRNDFPCAVVGVDIASGENHFSHDSPLRQGHFEMCQKAKELGLNVTIHAGETPDSAQNVQTAIDSYGAKRIGHGYNITNTPEIMDHVKARNIHLEVCLTSSVETGGWEKTEWKDHPSLVFREWGISQSLSSDDPAVFNTSLTWQYRIAMKKMGLSEDDILRMTEDAIQAAFISKDEKTELLEKARSFTVEHKTIFRDRVHYEK
jgi:adenosine deaminase